MAAKKTKAVAWTRNRGKRPVGDTVSVEIRRRDGVTLTGFAGMFKWRISGLGTAGGHADIMSWRRVRKPRQPKAEPACTGCAGGCSSCAPAPAPMPDPATFDFNPGDLLVAKDESDQRLRGVWLFHYAENVGGRYELRCTPYAENNPATKTLLVCPRDMRKAAPEDDRRIPEPAPLVSVHQTVWIAGRCHSGSWDFQGVFLDEQEAVGECVDDTWFVAPAVVGHALLHGSEPWPGLYYPRVKASVFTVTASASERVAALMDKHGVDWSDHLNDDDVDPPAGRSRPWMFGVAVMCVAILLWIAWFLGWLSWL